MKIKKIIALLLTLAIALTLASCNDGNDSNDENAVIAKVADTEITQAQLDQYTYLYCYVQGLDISKASDEDLDYIKSYILEDYIALQVMELYYADDENILPENYQTQVDKFLDEVSAQESASEYMENYGVTDQALTEFFVSQYYSVAFFNELDAETPEVTDEEVRNYYDQNQAQFEVDEVTAKHILVKEEDLAKDILKELKEGADFSELAKEHSTDGSAAQGGDLGTFGRGEMVPEFEEAAFALEAGELSDVVQTQFGYHIILVTDKNQGKKTFEEAEQTIRSYLKNTAIGELYKTRIAELRDEFGVEYTKK